MYDFIFYFFAALLTVSVVSWTLAGTLLRRTAACLFTLAFFAIAIIYGDCMEAWQRLAIMSAGLLYLIKGTYILSRYSREELSDYSPAGFLIYMTIWPGLDLSPFKKRVAVEEDGRRFVHGFLFFFSGILLLILTSIFQGTIGLQTAGWLTLFALLFTIHLGYADMLSAVLRVAGYNVKPLFDKPYMPNSLHDFWSKRWNYAFVEMNKLIFLPAIRKVTGNSGLSIFLVFALSGVLHELAVSYPANALFGLPFIYFIIQGMGFFLEKKLFGEQTPEAVKRMWTFGFILLPLPLLFNFAFQETFFYPLMSFTHDVVLGKELQWWFSLALWFAAAGNFTCIAAGAQLPYRLNWKEELFRLSTFNRKIFLNYYAYIGLSIFSWGVITLFLHDEILAGDKAALVWTFFMGIFWGVRLLVDIFFFDHKDWPAGPEMVIGHTCLTSVFIALTATYLGIFLWHMF